MGAKTGRTIILACTVRGCAAPLEDLDAVLRCPAGHSFDRARGGYWNLLQPQDRRSAVPGDPPGSVDARARWLARGLSDGLADAIASLAAPDAAAAVVDVGCGEGSMARRLFGATAERLCGVDLSSRAVRAAARRMPGAVWAVANADRFVPLVTGTVDLALSLFGRRPAAELARVLAPGGKLLVAVPGDDDLLELRQAAKGRGERIDRVPRILVELGPSFRLVTRRTWRARVGLDRSAIEDALAMTYRGARHAERRRLAGLEEIETTLSADLLLFGRDSG